MQVGGLWESCVVKEKKENTFFYSIPNTSDSKCVSFSIPSNPSVLSGH